MKRLALAALLLLTGASEVESVIPAEFGLVEGIAFDPRSRRLFAGSVDQSAFLVREEGKWRRAVLPYRTGGLFGMAVDARRGLLWITSGVAAPTMDKQGFRGLIGVTTLGFEAHARVPLPVGDERSQPGDVALGANGAVYVSDSAAGNIFVCEPGCTVLAPLVPRGTFASPQGMAVSRDGRTLFVADYQTGLWRIDLKKPKGKVLVASADPLLGIDGLVRDGDALIAIRNGGAKAVLRLTLDATGTSVTDVTQLDAPGGEGEPTLGTIVGPRLLYIADANWDRFNRDGTSIGGLRATSVRAINLPPGPRPPEPRVKINGERDTGPPPRR